MNIQLRPYQEDLLNNINKSLQTNKLVLATAPTGAGKTILAFQFIKEHTEAGKRILFVVNREELVFQSLDKFRELEAHISILKAGYQNLYNADKPIQIIMLQTWHARRQELEALNPDIIMVDEVHDGWGAKRLNEMLAIYSEAKILGLTATPIDDKGYLIKGFDDYIQDIQIKELIEEGYLVKPRVLIPDDTTLDLKNVKCSNFDYQTDALDEVLLEVGQVENVVKQFKNHASKLKTIVFANSIRHAEALLEEFKKQGFNADVLHSQLKNLNKVRKQLLVRFKKGDMQIIINVGILTTGFDEGSVECILLARPTKILRLYIQIAGRGLRTCKEINKQECLFLDCANIIQTHGYPDDIRIFQHKPYVVKPDEVKVDKKTCPECEMLLSLQVRECPYCGYEFTTDDPDKLPKQEAQKLIELGNIQEDCLSKLKQASMRLGYKKGYSFYLMKDIAKLKPVKGKAYVYYKKVLNIINTMIEKNYKPTWVIYQILKVYKREGIELNCIKVA